MVNTEGSEGTDPVIPLNATSRQSDSNGGDPLHCDDVAPSGERAGIREVSIFCQTSSLQGLFFLAFTQLSLR